MTRSVPSGASTLGAGGIHPGVAHAINREYPGLPQRIISTTNHVVVSIGSVAVAKYGNPQSWDAVLETTLLCATGIPARIIEADGEVLILMAHAGEPVSVDEFAASLPEIGRALRQMHSENGLSQVSGLEPLSIERIHTRLARRGIQSHPAHIRDWFTESLNGIQELPSGGSTVVHSDPHPGNWVRTGSGTLRLIDWESAALSHPEVDLAGIVHASMIRGIDPDPFLHEYGEHDAGKVTTFLTVKTISAAAHLLWSKGEAEFTQRREVLIPELCRRWGLTLAH